EHQTEPRADHAADVEVALERQRVEPAARASDRAGVIAHAAETAADPEGEPAGAIVETAGDSRPLLIARPVVALRRRERRHAENRKNEEGLDRLHNGDLGTAEGRD